MIQAIVPELIHNPQHLPALVLMGGGSTRGLSLICLFTGIIFIFYRFLRISSETELPGE